MVQTMLKTAAGREAVPSDAALWAKYKTTGDTALRNELVMHNTHLVEKIARRMWHVFSGKSQLEDIVSNGMITLIKAVESFDPLREIKFETYASIRIRGSIVDYIRSQDWVPRTARERADQIEDCFARLRDRFLREPTLGEIAGELNMERTEVEKILCDAHPYNIMSFEDVLTGRDEGFDIEDVTNLPPHALYQKKELKKVLAQAIDQLSLKERTVISLFYYEDLKIREIADVMGISSSRVCQIHSAALMKLKAGINDYMSA